MAVGTVNVPGKTDDNVKAHAETHLKGGSDPIDLSKLGAQEAISGKQGQYVGFNKDGKPVASNFDLENMGAQKAISGEESQYVGFDKDGKPVAKDFPNGGDGITPGSGSGMKIFTGVLGTNWTEDEKTGVKVQDVHIEGILKDHNGNIDHDDPSIDGTSEGYALYVEEENQWLTHITNGRMPRTYDGFVRFEIFGDPNTVEIPFWVGVL